MTSREIGTKIASSVIPGYDKMFEHKKRRARWGYILSLIAIAFPIAWLMLAKAAPDWYAWAFSGVLLWLGGHFISVTATESTIDGLVRLIKAVRKGE